MATASQWFLVVVTITVVTAASTSGPPCNNNDSDLVKIVENNIAVNYSLFKNPPVNSLAVLDRKDELVGALNLNFVSNIHNGMGAGLQIQLQTLRYDISGLFDKCAVTFTRFKETAKTAFFDLKAAFQFLLKGKEKVALDSFSSLAGKMAKAAEELQTDFSNQTKVKEVLKSTMKAVVSEQILKVMDLKSQQEKAKGDLQVKERLAKENETLEEIIPLLLKMHCQGLAESTKMAISNQILKIMDLESQEEKAKVDVKVLAKETKRLKEIIRSLAQAALFSNNLKTHYQDLADNEIQDRIQTFIDNFPEQERIEHWASNQFKEQLFIYISKWVALHSVSSEYLDQIKQTQKQLLDYMDESPTCEQSKENLVENFEEDLSSAQMESIEAGEKGKWLKEDKHDEL